MASELTLTATLEYTPADGRTRSIEVPELFLDTTRAQVLEQVVGIVEEALEMGDVASPTAVMIVNLDATNFVNVKAATAGAIVAKLKKDTNGDGNGGVFLASELGSGMQAPFVIADTDPCRILILVAE